MLDSSTEDNEAKRVPIYSDQGIYSQFGCSYIMGKHDLPRLSASNTKQCGKPEMYTHKDNVRVDAYHYLSGVGSSSSQLQVTYVSVSLRPFYSYKHRTKNGAKISSHTHCSKCLLVKLLR